MFSKSLRAVVPKLGSAVPWGTVKGSRGTVKGSRGTVKGSRGTVKGSRGTAKDFRGHVVLLSLFRLAALLNCITVDVCCL